VPVSFSRADILQSCRHPSVVPTSFSHADILQQWVIMTQSISRNPERRSEEPNSRNPDLQQSLGSGTHKTIKCGCRQILFKETVAFDQGFHVEHDLTFSLRVCLSDPLDLRVGRTSWFWSRAFCFWLLCAARYVFCLGLTEQHEYVRFIYGKTGALSTGSFRDTE